MSNISSAETTNRNALRHLYMEQKYFLIVKNNYVNGFKFLGTISTILSFWYEGVTIRDGWGN